MPANTRGQRNVQRKEAARQKRQTYRNAPQKKPSRNKYAYYVSKKNRSIRRPTTVARSTRKSSKKEVNIKKIIGRLIVLLFQLKIDPVSLVKRDPELKQYFSGINLNVSRFGAKTPYSFPFPTSSTSSPPSPSIFSFSFSLHLILLLRFLFQLFFSYHCFYSHIPLS
jgi:hypothetical protein